MSRDISARRVVVIGGGTGTFVVLSGLKRYPDIDLSAIITVADSGGSTGRLRDEFGFLPVGDLRQSLAALALENSQSWIRDLLLYRFSAGTGLKGHNLGNLILTALQDMAGSTPKALAIAGDIFRLRGHIYPSTLTNVQLVTTYADGSRVVGEHHLDNPQSGGKAIKHIALKPPAKIYPPAGQAIRVADLIIIGPGDLYGSLMPNLIVQGAASALRSTKAKIVYIVNLMTHFSQTNGLTAADHVRVISQALGRAPDFVMINTGRIPQPILAAYARQHEYPVVDDLPRTRHIIRGNFVASSKLLRHDQRKLTQVLVKYLEA